ncbi:MAG: M28 family peptidase [Anaerolineales bacterium]|jgi:Zn-dependent M28 family amino/carboxypeptidase
MNKYTKIIFKLIILISIVFQSSCNSNLLNQQFDGDRAYNDVAYQLSLGPRIPGSTGHRQIIEWIYSSLVEAGWQVESQQSAYEGIYINNIIAKRGEGNSWVILGAHFDTRMYADQDPEPENRTKPVPGANDGASGVSVLFELARIIPKDIDREIWLVFFDAEDNGGIDGTDWALGSQYFVDNLTGQPDAVVVLDMIGDKDLDIYIEKSSNQELVAEIWEIAEKLGHEEFIDQPKYHMIDDHTAFLLDGIPAIDIIDFDYPYWHTVEDTLDKVSSESLQIVGETIFMWLMDE